MLERRQKSRRRVCLSAQIVGDLTSAPQNVRLRTISDGGFELTTARECLPGEDVLVLLDRDNGKPRSATVVWRSFDRFGLSFMPGSRPSDDAVPGPLSKLLRDA
ncbi:DNA polymerase I [Fulvimarina pelagi HTCC2506]|uniref:DNA polymerase I n=1 Tax=Fulvimarina pelagi HTCC2506 TaxID=314231 RepID=Q0G498_9HYPH|nr:PilZ domain-containing protein [Fulvimarina pelagi]EAU41583.1 DNA polymerase I [Fulvimarina pelagi HTCC2506]